jgi:16S rRNA (guanine527-N7)-methyltransferase
VLQELIEREGRVLDVGSGAGLPGVVLAIVRPDVQVTLLEPMARRVAFLEALVAELELPNLLVLRGRAEEQVGKLHFPVVTARAVAPLDRLAKWCLPLLEVNGSLMAMKGSSVAEELAAHASAIRAAGGDDVTVKVCGAEILAQPTTVVEIVRRRSTTRGGRRSR